MKKFRNSTATIVVLSIIASLLIAQSSFATVKKSAYYSDVNDSNKFFKGINLITEAKIVSGYSDGTYRPFADLNRAELLKILVESSQDTAVFVPYANDNCFKDVVADQWFTEYVCFGKDAGIVQGYGDGSFKPAQNVTLVEGLKMMLKSFGYSYLTTDPWYKDVVAKSSSLNSIPLDFTAFDQNIKRGQMADMIARVLTYRDVTQDAYLGDLKTKKVTYATISSGINVENPLPNDDPDIIDDVVPSDVPTIAAVGMDKSVKVSWTAATDNVAVKGYKIFYGTSSVTKPTDDYDHSVDVGKVLESTITDLTNGTRYYFAVVAYDAAGNESEFWSPEVSAIPKVAMPPL